MFQKVSSYANYSIAFILAMLLTLVFVQVPYFWDTVFIPAQVSTYYYTNGFHPFSLPPFLDVGHTPLTALYYAVGWWCFGKSIVISHVLQLPFIFLFLLFFIKIIQLLSANKLILLLALALLLTDMCWLSMCSQPGYELQLLAFTCLAIYLLLRKYIALTNWKKLHLLCYYIAIIVLPLLVIKGVINVVFIFFIEFYLAKKERNIYWQKAIPYLLSALVFCSWLLLHYHYTGYWLTAPHTSWGNNNNGITTLTGVYYNSKFIIWRLLDFGRIGIVCCSLGLLLFLYFKKQIQNNTKVLLALCIICFMVFAANQLIMNKAILHRYFLCFFCFQILLFVVLIQQVSLKKYTKWLLSICVLCCNISGYYWVYPQHISMGYESNINYLHYFTLRNKAFHYISKNNIEATLIGTYFPLTINKISTLQNTTWNDNQALAMDIDDYRFEDFEYILYSNYCPDFKNYQIQHLQKKYSLQWQANEAGFVIELYHKK